MIVQDLCACMRTLPSARAAELVEPLTKAMADAEIIAPWRAPAFLAQLGHEAIDLRHWEEIGGASNPRYDGFHGRGPIQLTWRATYEACGKALGVDLVEHPALLLTPEIGFASATWFWNSRGLNALADAIETQGRAAFDEISRRINGRAAKQSSLDDRWRRWLLCYPVMSTPTVVL